MPLFDLNQALVDPLKEEEGNQPEAILFGSGHHDRKANRCTEPPQQEETRAGKWMSSKTRCLTRKMIDSSTGETIRACSDCNTTKTPLWRSGPNGPKSLCNACGIRQRKARRVMAGTIPPPPALPTNWKARTEKKKVEVDRSLPLKKRSKLISRTTAAATSAGKLCFDGNYGHATLGSRNNRSATQEQRDAAILLMTLSCGLL